MNRRMMPALLLLIPTIAFAQGVRTTVGDGPDAIPLIVVSGTPFEMGQQMGELMGEEVRAVLNGFVQAAKAEDPNRCSDQNLDAVWEAVSPHTDPRFIEELRGIAAGAGLSFETVRRAHTIPIVGDYSCSALAVWGQATRNEHLYQIRNLDYTTDAGLQDFPLIVIYKPDVGIAHVNVTFAGAAGCNTGMNAEGIALSEVGDSPESDYPFHFDGQHFTSYFRTALYDARSLNDALGVIRNTRRIKKYFFVVGDGQEPQAAKLKAYAPDLTEWRDNDPSDTDTPKGFDDVVYHAEGRDPIAYAHLTKYYGDYDARRMIQLSKSVATPGGNLLNVVYDATALEMWVAYAEKEEDAFQRPYIHVDLTPYFSELRIPGATAYIAPDPDGARVSGRGGVTGWTNPELEVQWFGLFRQTGAVTATVDVRLPKGERSDLELTIDGQSRRATAEGTRQDKAASVPFGDFEIKETGYQKITLRSLSERQRSFGVIESLTLAGPAVRDAHFNLKDRRNAASVHLMYPVPPDTDIQWFYNEVIAVEDPTTTFYMACGFHRGYFGMQVNSETERRIIFSVWDSGNEAIDRSKVGKDDLVHTIAKGEGVYASGFGNEGTGGHSHLKVMWKTGEPQRFLLGAQPVGDSHTVYAGYWFDPEKKEWMLISAMKAPKDGGWIKRPHSFSENFWGSNGHVLRKALYGPQWIRTTKGEWLELTEARFSHDPTGKADRLDRFMGVEDGKFFLSHGGFVPGYCDYGDAFTRPATTLPEDIELPEIPTK